MVRKRDIPLPSRTPAYVSREVGAAELCIAPQTWDDWVRDGVLPKPTVWLGKSRKTPRWRWKDVDEYLAGRPIDDSPPPEPEDDGPFFRDVHRVRGGENKP